MKPSTESFSYTLPSGASLVVILLLKGVLYKSDNEEAWQSLFDHESSVRDYLKGLYLEVIVDASEGFAFVRQAETTTETERDIPRLIQKRPLGYLVSLLCALLRKRLVEHDHAGGSVRLVLSREHLLEMVRVFLKDTNNEARLEDAVDRAIKKLTEYGFLHRLRGSEENLFEVRRIIKALIDASWLSDFNQLLEDYKKHADLTL